MASKVEKQKMREHLRNFPEHVRKNVEVLEPTYPFALHISANPKIDVFYPMVSKRGLSDEDRSIPRVSTASTLWGCIVGYSSLLSDFRHEHSDDWLGGYVIYGLPHKLKLRPNSTLLPDVTQSDEEWIVGFDNAHRNIVPQKLGKLFAHRVAITSTGSKSRLYDITLYLELNRNAPTPFPALPEHGLAPGYWKLEVLGVNSSVYWDPAKITVHQIDKDEYQSKKKLSAGLLSFEGLPPSTLWIS